MSNWADMEIPKLGQKIQPDKEMIRHFNEAMDDGDKAIDLYVDLSSFDDDVKKMLKKQLRK